MEIDRKKVLELGDIKNNHILDIGAGDLAIIAARDFNCNVTSIDVSYSILEEERERVRSKDLEENITLEKEDAVDLSYQNSTFDAVISYGALHHNDAEKRERFIEEIIWVAKDKVLIADFKPEHHIHPEDVHPSIDHKKLRGMLKEQGVLQIYEGEEKVLYVLVG